MDVATSENAADRLSRRIEEIFKREQTKPRDTRLKKNVLADLLDLKPSTITQTIQGRHNSAFRLVHLDTIATYLQTTPSALIRKDENELVELSSDETRLVTHWRNWDAEVRSHVLTLIDYFAGLLPEEQQERRFWMQLRQLSPTSRREILNAITDARRAERAARKTRDAAAERASTGGTKKAVRIRDRGRRRTTTA